MFARPNMVRDVRFGSGTTILTKTTDVRFAPESGHRNSARNVCFVP